MRCRPLVAYLDHEASGASGFIDMGDKWVRVRDAAHNGTLRAADPEAPPFRITSGRDELAAPAHARPPRPRAR
jgi:hypothetical protein